MNLSITKAMVIVNSGADEVCLETTAPSPYAEAFDPKQHPLTVTFKATKGTGADYVRENFGIEPEVIDTEVNKLEFSRNKYAQ